MANKVGKLIKEARTNAGFTQEQLAKKVKGVSAADISKAERGELKLTQDNLKDIAKATGVTQKSLLEAASSSTYKSSSSKSASSKSSSKSSTSKSSTSSMKLTATEKKLVELYRDADTSTKKDVMKLLKGTDDDNNILQTLLGDNADDVINSLIGGSSSKKSNSASDLLGSLLSGASDLFS